MDEVKAASTLGDYGRRFRLVAENGEYRPIDASVDRA